MKDEHPPCVALAAISTLLAAASASAQASGIEQPRPRACQHLAVFGETGRVLEVAPARDGLSIRAVPTPWDPDPAGPEVSLALGLWKPSPSSAHAFHGTDLLVTLASRDAISSTHVLRMRSDERGSLHPASSASISEFVWSDAAGEACYTNQPDAVQVVDHDPATDRAILAVEIGGEVVMADVELTPAAARSDDALTWLGLPFPPPARVTGHGLCSGREVRTVVAAGVRYLIVQVGSMPDACPRHTPSRYPLPVHAFRATPSGSWERVPVANLRGDTFHAVTAGEAGSIWHVCATSAARLDLVDGELRAVALDFQPSWRGHVQRRGHSPPILVAAPDGQLHFGWIDDWCSVHWTAVERR